MPFSAAFEQGIKKCRCQMKGRSTHDAKKTWRCNLRTTIRMYALNNTFVCFKQYCAISSDKCNEYHK
jgi:hypothetical protein